MEHIYEVSYDVLTIGGSSNPLLNYFVQENDSRTTYNTRTFYQANDLEEVKTLFKTMIAQREIIPKDEREKIMKRHRSWNKLERKIDILRIAEVIPQN